MEWFQASMVLMLLLRKAHDFFIEVGIVGKRMTDDLWSFSPPERLGAARQLTPIQRKELVDHLIEEALCKPWPYGMPTVVNPLVVVIGVSPGNSPDPEEADSFGRLSSYPPPTVGVAHPKMHYNDTRRYWSKVRQLFVHLIQSMQPEFSETDCLALSGHLNLGTGQKGEADDSTLEPEIVRWLPRVVSLQLRPRILICFGLNGFVKKPCFQNLWGNDLLTVRWSEPDVVSKFAPYNYAFRLWKAQCPSGSDLLIVSWPNHPSRHPFAGLDDGIWRKSLDIGVELLGCRKKSNA
jgi:hypothetical protein